MAQERHGVYISQRDTSVSTPVLAESGLPFVVGTAPVQLAEQPKINVPVLCYTWEEAVKAFGYSDDWEKYTLCEMMYSHFRLYGVSPVVLVNVFDPERHKTVMEEKTVPLAEGQALLPPEALIGTVTVKNYVRGTDYELFYGENALIVERLDSGSIPANAAELIISCQLGNPKAVTVSEIIGGYNVSARQSTGLELIDSVYPSLQVIPDLLLAPGWSGNPEVAAIMAAKAQAINGLFEAKALIDVDTEEAPEYTDVPAWKKKNNLFSKYQILFYPKLRLGGKTFHLSVQAAGLMAATDTGNGGCPFESPSNKLLQADGTVRQNGTEMVLDIQQANFLNGSGVVTAQNFMGGFRLWGNKTACAPGDADVKNYFIPVSRMFAWMGNSLILTYWNRLDRPMTPRLIDTILDSVNIWMNGLVAEEKLLGGHVEFLQEENSTESLMAGKMHFHLWLTPPSPAQEIDFVLEYDVSALSEALKMQ